MADVKKPVVEKAAKAPRKKVIRKVIVGIDKSPEDVLKLASEGHTLFFEDGDDFLELPEEIVSELNGDTKKRYRVAKAIASGEDVMGTAVADTLGFSVDYNVRPGSAGETTAVYGKDPNREYHWGRPDKHNKHMAEGYEVDVDPSVSTRFGESGTQKTLGGQNKREATLYSRPKKVGQELRAKRKALRDSRLLKTQNSAKEAAIKLGARITS